MRSSVRGGILFVLGGIVYKAIDEIVGLLQPAVLSFLPILLSNVIFIGGIVVGGLMIAYGVWKSKNETIRARKTAVPSQQPSGSANPPLDLVQKQEQREIHHQHLLAVYRKWAKYVTTYPGLYNYGSVRFRIHIEGLPEQEDYYREARTDLECYKGTYELLLNAEKQVEESDTRGGLIVNDMKEEVSRYLSQYGLKEWNKGGREADKWYYYHIITLLIVKPIAEGTSYKKPKLVLQNGNLRAPEEGYDLAGTFRPSEATRGENNSVIKTAQRLVGQSEAEAQEEKELKQTFYGVTTELVPKLSKRILDLQVDLKRAEIAYAAFRDSLLNDVIKRPETRFPIPDGGKCEICLALRA